MDPSVFVSPPGRLPADPTRSLVEFYRRRGEIDLWLPISS